MPKTREMKLHALQPRLWGAMKDMASLDMPLRHRLRLLIDQFVTLGIPPDDFPKRYQKDVQDCIARGRAIAHASNEELTSIAAKAMPIVHAVFFDLYDDDDDE